MDFILQGIIKAFHLLFQGDADTFSAISATVRVSTYSMACSLALGTPAGFMLGYYEFPGKKQLRVVVDTLLALPTVFIPTMRWEIFYLIPKQPNCLPGPGHLEWVVIMEDLIPGLYLRQPYRTGTLNLVPKPLPKGSHFHPSP